MQMNQKRDTLDNENIGLKGIVVNYLFHWRFFLGTFLVALLGAILYLAFYPKTYAITASIKLQDEKELGSGSFGLGEAAGITESFRLGAVGNSVINMEDELQMLNSYSIFKEAIIDLNMYVCYEYPWSMYEHYENKPIKVTMDTEQLDQVEFPIELLVRSSRNQISVVAEMDGMEKKSFSFESLPAHISYAGKDFLLEYNDPERVESDFKMYATIPPIGKTTESLRKAVNIEDYFNTSNVVILDYDDYERQRGKDLLNKIIDIYQRQVSEYKIEQAEKSVAFLNGRIDSVIRDLKWTELAIANYKDANRLTTIEYDVMFYVEQMKEIQGRLIELETQSHTVDMLDSFIKDPENKYNLVPVLLSTTGESEGAISLYNQALLERSRIIQNSNMNNPLAITLTDQVDQLRESVFKTIENARKSVELVRKDLKEKETMLFQRMGEYPSQEMDYIEMRRQQEIFQGIYLILLQQREGLLLSIGSEKSRVYVIDYPYVKAKPVAPRKLYAAFGIILFTLIIPVGYLFVKEHVGSVLTLYREEKKRRKASV